MQMGPIDSSISSNSIYQLKVFAYTTYPKIANITINFTSTNVIINNSILTNCSTDNSITYSDCYCQDKTCYFPSLNANIPGSSAYPLYMGYFQNPPFVKDQNVLITVTFQASPVYSVTNSIIVSGYVAGTIYSQSLLQDSFKRAAKTNYTIYFNIKNTILLNGVITLSFPLESSLNYIQNVYWKSYTDESEYTVSFSNTSSTISLKSLFTIHALSPNASGVLMIRIDAIQNPSILINTTSITIKTTNNQDNAIDQISTGLIIRASIPGEIQITTIGPVDQFPTTINMETSLFFLIQPEVNYPRNGSLEIDFPAQFSFNETSFKCEFIIGFTDYDENTKGYCFKNKSSILVLNSFYSSVTSPLIFVIHGVLNPNSTAVTNSFYFQTTDQNTNVICKSYTNYSFSATPGNLTLLENPYRNINLAGSPFYLIVKVLNTNPFPKGGFVKIWVPLEQGILIDNNVSCGFYVSNAVASIQNCEVVNQTMGVEFWITEWCSYTSSCPKRSNLTFAINSGLINPYFISQDILPSIIISTYGSNRAILYDQINASVFIAPATKPIPINLINIFYGKSNITNTGELNIYVAKIQIIPYFIDYSGSIKIYFPYNAVNYLNFSPITCELVICTNNETNCLQYPRECNFSTYSSLNSINYVQIFDICKDKNCLSEVMLRITNLRSPISLKPLDNLNSTNFYGGQCLTLDNKIISFSTQTDVPKIVLLALPFQNIVLNISDSTTTKLATYILSFFTSIEIPLTGSIELVFPKETYITNTSLHQILINNTVNSNINFFCSSQSSNCSMTHSLDPMLFFFQTKIQIQLTEIMNPRSEATTSVFKLSSKTNDSYTIQTSTFNATMKMASDIQNVILIRDNIYLNNATNLTLEFVTLTDLYPTDYFELQISKDQVTTNYPKLIRVQTSDKRNLSIKTIDNDTNFIYLTFSDSYCLPCSSNSTLSYILTGFFNIGTTRLAIISNIIFVKDQNSFLIQEKKFGFFIKPNLASGNLSITNLKLSSLTTGTDTNLSLAFKPQSSVSNGILFVTFPTEFFFVKNYLNKNCTVQNNLYDFYNCSLNLITGSYYGEFISSLMIYNISCDPLSLFQITIIDTLRNKPTNQPNNDNIFFMTLDSNKNIIDLSVKKANDYIPVQLNQFKDLLFVRSNNFVSSHTNLSVEFRILNRIAVNANIIIHLPKKQILTNSNTSCYSNNVLESNNPILCNISSNSDYSIIKFQEFCMQNNKVYGYCPENTLFQLNLVNLINNLAVKIDSYSIQIEIVTSDSLYSYERELNGFFEMSLQMTKFQNFTIELNETNVAKSVLVTFSFVLPSPISQNGTILFNFPGDLFDYTNNQCNFYLLGTLNTIKTCNLITQINKDFNNLQIIGLNLTDSCTNTVNCLSNQEISLNFTAINIMHQSEKFSQIILKSFTSQNENISILQYNISEINFTEYNIDKDIFILRDNATLNQKSNLKMEFITPGRVIYNATMKFSLPKNQILLNINTLKIVILSPINQTLKNDQFIITNDANYYFLILNQSFCPNFCNESTNISIILVGISNPSNVKYLKYNAFFLQIFYLNETQFIFSALNGVYANPELILPSLVDVLIKRSNGVLNETIILLINFNVPKDNGRNLINNSLLIDFPDNLFYGNFPNFSIFYNGISLKNLDNQTMINKTMDNYSNLYIKTVQIDNFCNNICETGQNLTLQIQKLQNPALYFSNINNLNLNLYILSNNSLIMNKIKYNSVNIQPNIELLDIIQHSFSRNTSSPKSSVDVILDFELTSYIIPESIIQIIIPQTQIILSTQIFCLNSINNINFRCNLSSNSNITHYILTFQEFCTANSINCSNIPRRISITIKNCINPLKTPLKTNRNSITISVFSNFFNLYQQTQNNIFLYPDIYQFYLNYIKITRSSHIAGSVATYSFQITLPQTTSNDVVFLISFPEFLAYSSQNLNCDQKYMCNIITSEAFNYITQITMKNICQSTNNCLTNNLISLNFDLINQGNTYDYQINRIFSVIIESNDQIIEIARGDIRASILPAIKPGIFYFISLNSSSFKVNENMSWNLSFFISNNFQNIQNSGSININLPNEINVSTISSCEVQIFNYSNINCKVQFLNKLITLSHSSGGNENLEGRQILVIINKLLSPMSLKPTSSLIFSSFGKINGSIVKFDEMTNGTIFQAIYPGNMSMAFIERSSNILNTEISLKLNFTTSTKNNDNGMVLINVLNSDEVEFSSSNTLKCVDYLTNIPFNCSRYNNFVLISNLSNYVSNTSWTITITGLKNLYYISEVLNKYFFTIESRTSDNYLIDSTSNIHAMPKLKSGSLYISNIIRNNNEITDEISLTINLNITNQIYQNNSFLKITFPEEFLLSSLVYSLKCQINEITLSCSNVLYYDNYFVSYMSISDLKQLHTNSNLKILINFGMKNTFYVNPVNLPIIFQTYLIISDRQISGLLDQTSINSNDFLKTLSPKLILTPAISCINCAINEITDLVFRFDITHILLRNIWVKIKIPSNISFADFLENENKCVGLIGFNNNLSCFSQKNELWLHNDFNTLVMPGFFSFLIKKTKNPIVSGNYSGFNISLYYNQTYLMDYTNQDITLTINPKNSSYFCDTFCQTCTETISECLSCFSPSYYPFYDPYQKKCLNECYTGTFLSSQKTCEKCYNACSTCEGPSNLDCLSCKSGFYFLDGSCVYSCPENTKNNDNTFFCENSTCLNNCELCGLNKSYCLTCKTGYFYDNVRKGCRNDSKCDGNNFFSNGTCLRCNKNCLACHGVSSNCTSCVDFYNKNKLFMVNDTGTCLSDCPAHYFGEIQYIINTTTILNYMCKACDVNCLTCKDSLVSSCLSCNTSEKTTKYLQYGTCISNCIDNFILTDPSTCRQNCSTVTKCYKCSTNNDSQCLSCISPYDILLKDECYSEEQICNNSHQFISSNNPTTCSECDSTCRTCKKSSKNCLSCYNQSIYFQFLYNDKCVMNCPAGYSPDYGDNMSCKDFICDNPCEKCLHNQSTCYECNNNTPYFFENYCFEKCPDKTSYNAILKVCVTSEKQKSEIWASWIVFSVFVMLTGFFIFSLFFSRNIINFESSVICLMQIAEFLSKILIFGFLFSFQEMAACVFSFISIVNNSLLSMMFQTLHIGVLEIHIRSFALFKSSNKKFYYFVLAGMLVFGINFTFAFSSGLFKFVKNEFETNFTYAKGLNRMVFFGFIFALMQLGVDCFVLSKYDNIEYDVFHLAYMNLIMNSVIYLIWGLQKIRAIIENLKKKIR